MFDSRIRQNIGACLPWLLLVAVLWAQLFFTASYAWSHGTYYDYGWYVPPLAVMFFARQFIGWEELGNPFPKAWITATGLLLLFPLLTALRIMEYVDGSWTLPLWIHAAVTSAITLALIHRAAGAASARRMIPVIIFALTAVQLPNVVEVLLVEKLTHSVIAASGWTMAMFGFPVTVVGSQLELGGAMVHVTEGCSGIRSAQSFLMASLFFGEWMRLPHARRWMMVGAGFATAWVLNVCRACALSLIRFEGGQQAFERAHDGVGVAAFFAGAAILLWVSAKLGSHGGPDTRTRPGRIVERRTV